MTTSPKVGPLCRDCLRWLRQQSNIKSLRPRVERRYTSTEARIDSRPSTERPLRVGIIGSGPAGFYAAARIIQKKQDAIVDMFEQLPAPFGLVRYGVAPDHPEVKNCQDKFEEVAESPRFNFIGNVAVGHDVTLRALKPHYDAFLFAYGASRDRTLGIPGEDLKGVVSARAFVGWYNGLPEYEGLDPDLTLDNTAHIVGNGNVALDVARVLLSPLDKLRHTDISDRTLDALSRSRVKHVHLYGRRGPMQAAFTIKEIRELMTLPQVGFEPMDQQLLPQADWISKLPRLEQRKYRLAALLAKGTINGPQGSPKSWSLRSLLSPSRFQSEASSNQLGAMTLEKNEYVDVDNRFNPSARTRPTGDLIEIPARLAFRSIGYKSSTLAGLTEDLGVPFDSKGGIIPNDMHGRVISAAAGPTDLTAKHVAGCYCAGWVKNGPTGVITSTMDDAFASADILLADWKNEVRFLNGTQAARREGGGRGWQGLMGHSDWSTMKQPRRVSWEDWKKIDAAERDRGKGLGKVREKFKDIKQMLSVLD